MLLVVQNRANVDSHRNRGFGGAHFTASSRLRKTQTSEWTSNEEIGTKHQNLLQHDPYLRGPVVNYILGMRWVPRHQPLLAGGRRGNAAENNESNVCNWDLEYGAS